MHRRHTEVMLQIVFEGLAFGDRDEKLLLLRSLCAVLGTALHTVGNTLSVESTTDDVVTYTRQVANSTAADEDYRVLLEIVTNTRDVARNLKTVGQRYSCKLTKCRVRLLRGRSFYSCANSSLLRRIIVCRLTLHRVITL